MDGTSQSIDRIRRARKSGSEMMADVERLPWQLDPHHAVTTPHAPGDTDVPAPVLKPTWPSQEPDQMLAAEAWWQVPNGEPGEENPVRQHGFLEDVANGTRGVDNRRSLEEDGLDDPLQQDAQYRDQSGLSQQDWEGAGGMSGRERMRVMSDQQAAAQQAKFDQAAATERRRAATREQSDKDFAEWQAGQSDRIAQAEKDRQAVHEERRAKQARQNAADSEAGFEAKLGADLATAPNFTVDPNDRRSRLIAQEENDDVARAAEYDQELFEHDYGNDPIESTPMEAPLPGEETLPPAVAGWAQRRAERGQGGLNALRARYHKEVPEDARSGSDLHSFEGWLARNGLKPDMPVMEAMPILNRLAPMDAVHVDRRREQYINTMMKRHASELQARGITREQLMQAYDYGVQSDTSGDPILAGSRAANKMIINGLKDGRDQQIAINHSKRVDQQNRGRDFGVPLGTVQFFDSLQAARTPQERANIFALAHAAQPRMGWDKMGAMLMKGEIDQDALTQWAQSMGGNAKPDPLTQIGQNGQVIANGPLASSTLSQARAEVQREMPNAKPGEQRVALANKMLPSIRNHIASGQPLSIEATTVASQVLSDDPADFAYQIGLPPNDPRVGQLYQQIHGKPVPQGWMGSFNSLGQWFGQFASPGAAQAAQPGAVPPEVRAWGGGT